MKSYKIISNQELRRMYQCRRRIGKIAMEFMITMMSRIADHVINRRMPDEEGRTT